MNVGTGSLEWAQRTGGRLSLSDKLGQLAQAVALQVFVLPAQIRWRLGFAEPAALRVDLEKLVPPDTLLARKAIELCSTVSQDYLTQHCLRSYLWARIFAANHSITFDDEFLFLACMTHDLGLTDAFGPSSTEVGCFSIASAEAARVAARELGWDAGRQDALAEAITLHVNVNVALGKGPEAHLLNRGTALDVTGIRYWEIPPVAVDYVVGRHPRFELKRRLTQVWNAEAEARPCSRAAFLQRYLQFSGRIASSPFPE